MIFERAIPIVSGVRFFNVSHNEKVETSTYLLNTILNTNLIDIYKIENGEIKNEFVVDVTKYLPSRIKNSITYRINRLDCLYLDFQDNKDIYTLFVDISADNYNYLYQFNLMNNDIVSFIPINPLYKTTKPYIGYTDITKSIYTDETEKVIHTRGLLYIDAESGNISGKYVRRIPCFVSKEEKLEFMDMVKSGEIIVEINDSEIESPYPIIDIWSSQHPVMLRLPSEIRDGEFDFSLGLGVLKFND